MRENWQYLILAFVLALVAWYSVSGREKVDVWMQVSVQFTGMPENLVVRDSLLQKINVRVRGPKGLVRSLEEKPLVYSMDLSQLKQGVNVLRIERDKFPLTKPFEVVDVNPPRAEIHVDRLATREAPVKPVWEGTLDPDYQLMNVVVQPEVVTIRGPEKTLTSIRQVETQVIFLAGSTPGLIEQVTPLSLPDEIVADPGFVNVRLQFGVKTKVFNFELPLTLENRTDYAASLSPDTIKADVEIPLPLVREGKVEESVSATVTAEPFLGPGSYPRRPAVSAPEGGNVLSIEPNHVELTLRQKKKSDGAGASE